LIHDNGGRPYTVFDKDGLVEIYTNEFNENKDRILGKLILKQKYKKIFLGHQIHKEPNKYKILHTLGNTILLHISSNKYLFMGGIAGIYTFETADNDIIKDFSSPIGNSDVPYPFAIGEKYTYLLIKNLFIPNDNLDMTKDPYAQYYNFDKQHGYLKKNG
jgi:hypothetical protein